MVASANRREDPDREGTLNAHGELAILLVEDTADHAELTLRALENGKLAHRAFWVKDGQEALDFLYRRGRYVDAIDAPRPDVILLDVHLPKINGQQVLRQIKADDDLRAIPVAMLTASLRENGLADNDTHGVVMKPVRPAELAEQLRAIAVHCDGGDDRMTKRRH